MIKIWGKLMKSHRIEKDMVLEYVPQKNRAETVRLSLNEFSIGLDIARPIWLPKNEKDLLQFVVTRFYKDQFMEGIDFDYLEVEIIGEEKKKSLLQDNYSNSYKLPKR